jgi:putative ABC transport system substrate-binding protein
VTGASPIIRALIACLAVATILLSVPTLGADAGQKGIVPRIGVLLTGTAASSPIEDGLRDGLRELGYVDGKTIALDWRRPKERTDELPRLATDLVHANADVLVAVGNAASRAAMQATATIPVVFISGDPITAGLATSLAHPGRNGTGLYVPTPELEAKRLELLHQLAPRAHRIAYLWNASNPLAARTLEEVRRAATALDLQLLVIDTRTGTELDAALKRLSTKTADGVLVGSDPLFSSLEANIGRAMHQAQLPAAYPWSESHGHGALMSYGVSVKNVGRRAAVYVDKVLKGVKPVDIPVEEVSKFELIIDLREAKALGLEVPMELLVRADEVIR